MTHSPPTIPGIEEPRRLLRDLAADPAGPAAEHAVGCGPRPDLVAALARLIERYDLLPLACLCVSDNDLIHYANQAAARLLGRPAAEVLQQPLCGYVLPEDRDEYGRYRTLMLTTDRVPPRELRLVRASGEHAWVRLDAVREHTESQATPLCYFVLTDITHQRQTEQELRNSRDLLSLFIQHSPIFTYIKEVTPTESRVLQASDHFREMLGSRSTMPMGTRPATAPCWDSPRPAGGSSARSIYSPASAAMSSRSCCPKRTVTTPATPYTGSVSPWHHTPSRSAAGRW